MIIDKESAVEDFKNFIELPILGRALYYKMQEYKDAIAANIKEFKNIVKIRSLVKKNAGEWPKISNDLEFEIVNVNGIWIPVLPGKKDCAPSRVIPGPLVNYIVKQAVEMDYGIIYRKSNLTLPRLSGRVFNIWFEKIREDYIYGIIKNPKIEAESKYNLDIDHMLNELKNIDYDKMFEILRLMLEDEDYRKEVFRAYQIWNKMFEPNLKVL